MAEKPVYVPLDERDSVGAFAQRGQRDGLVTQAIFRVDAFARQRIATGIAAGEDGVNFATSTLP